ncbi:MAG: DNA-directed polymerase subunit beta [Actinomycetota bacterium]|jgi:DNA-directed RNA polymerase subunit beta|nr:DNA-directed polymerase subunit beta [Actinomycetota bacterium]MDQ1505071.1 DNA-directed polymerase subunit beta [Actinomycetota bacterium]
MPLPDLVAVQRDSFKWFLEEGIAETLTDISPIEDFTGSLKLELADPEFEPPKYSEEECKEKDMTFSRPLFVTARFMNAQTGEIKEQTVFMGDFPMMTEKGTFIINGTERIVVSQLVRSPGVYFGITPDKTSPDLDIIDAKVIPGRGAWLEFEVDKKNTVYVRIDRKRKQPVTILLKALGMGDDPEALRTLLLDSRGQPFESIENTLGRDHTETVDDAFLDIYRKLRPGEPPTVESARGLLENLFFNPKRYDLAKVGRHKVNKKLKEEFDALEPVLERIGLERPTGADLTLTRADILATVSYLVKLHAREPDHWDDDIDHFGNRRIRSVGELIQNQVRIGLSRMERVVRERMTTQDVEAITPQTLINIRPVVAAIKEFFGSSQLSQFMDQTNPLSGLTHKRRLSALGPGGLSRERAGFEVRDVHPSHYGRMCPIETPEGPNIGLIGSLASYARVNRFGFTETPYRKVVNGQVSDETEYLAADDEDRYVIAQANAAVDEHGHFIDDKVLVRSRKGEVEFVSPDRVDYMDVSPKQIVSVATALIPFLEHDDANRALMGANMQKQAVPLVRPEAPYIGTGVEARAARDAGAMIMAEADCRVAEVTGDTITVEYEDGIGRKTYRLAKFRRSNQTTCINQRPLVDEGQELKKGEVLADGPSTDHGELALGKNLLVAFMSWEGYNFEDAIILSERLVRDDVLTSIHIEEHEIDARDTKLGAEEITRDIPNLSEEILKDLDERGIIRIGAEVGAGDVLVGKVTPKGETELTPEERLLRAIFGEKAREVRDTSLKVPHGETGKVIDVRVFSRDDGHELPPGVNQLVRVYVAQKRKISEGDKLAGRHGNKGVISKILPVEDMPYLADGTPLDIILNPLGVPSRMNVGQVLEAHLGYAARHGWGEERKSPIAPNKTRPTTEPAVWVESPVFDGAHWDEVDETGRTPIIKDILGGLHADGFDGTTLIAPDGKVQLYDGRSGRPYDRPITVGYVYILKLAHLVDDKIHARSTGPYSMITQQPLGGKAQFGGQRLGEMEVWALEAYGAAYALQELLTIKSDDVLGRVKVYEAIVKGENIPEPGIPESFKVLIKEMQSLCLNVEVISTTGEEIEMRELDEDVFRTAEELGIDLSRPEKGSDEEDERRREPSF